MPHTLLPCRYVRPVQYTTLPSQQGYIRAYMGYAVKYHGIHPDSCSLKLFLDAKIYAGFVGYLLARRNGKNSMAKQVLPMHMHPYSMSKLHVWTVFTDYAC